MNGMSGWLAGGKRGIGVAAAVMILTLGAAGCEDKSTPTNIAPTSSALTAPKAPASAGAARFAVDKAASKVDFMMEAPKEKIRGRVHGATTGDLFVNLEDITKTTGLLDVDISGIEVYQTTMDDKGQPGPETKSDLQNTHVRNWLEIGADAPEAEKTKNSKAQFAISSIETAGEKNLTKIPGAERKVTFTVKGDFQLHQHKAPKSAEIEATFTFSGDKPTGVAFKTTKPISIDLAEFEVKPRDAFGKFALKTLSDLAPKVAKEAQVSLDLTAKAFVTGGGTEPAKAP